VLLVSIFEAIALGLVQGLTEFFPVSSSGHLKLVQTLFGLENLSLYLPFDLVCHLGTIFSILLVFRKDILSLFQSERKLLFLIVISGLPLLPLYPFLSYIKRIYDFPQILGGFFLCTALLLYLGEKFTFPRRPDKKGHRVFYDAFTIGVFQAVALMPGISRSGATISAASMLGWKKDEAARFSFLMSVPPILGGVAIELRTLLSGKAIVAEIPISHYFIGFSVSFAVGLMALLGVLHLVKKKSLLPFAWYCAILGVLSLIYLNFLNPMVTNG
jgi:undecaprenyl-diphosphatase